MPNNEMRTEKPTFRRFKKSCSITATEQSKMLEIKQVIYKPKRKILIKYKYHLIILFFLIVFFVVFFINLPNIKVFFKEKQIERHLIRNFSEIDMQSDTPIVTNNPKELLWNNEKDLYTQRIRREINSYKNDKTLSYENEADFTRRENPKISLVIPVYNKETFLLPLYRSIQNQSLKDIEIIFIDDNSSDNSINLIQEFMQKDKRIILLRHDKNYRTFYSRNEGARHAKGKYILFIDPDDLIVNNILEKSYVTAEKYNLDIVQFYFLMGNFKITKLSTEFKYKSGILYQPEIKEIFYYGQTRNLWDKLIKKEIYIKSEEFMNEEYKNERYEIHDDDAVFYGLIKMAQSFGFLEQIGYFYNIKIPESTTKTKFNSEKINKIFQALFTIMKYYYMQSDDSRKEKLMVGYQFFYSKVYIYKNYIQYMTEGFNLVVETLNLYINSPYILNSEKYFLKLFKEKVMIQLRNSFDNIK